MVTWSYKVITPWGAIVATGLVTAKTAAAAKAKVRRMPRVSYIDLIYVLDL